MAAETLSMDQIAGILAGQRTRGDYDAVLDDFLNSGEAGVRLDLTSGNLVGKTPDQVSVGINNAKTRIDKNSGQPVHPGGHNVKVLKRNLGDKENEDWAVFLIDTSKVTA